MSHHWGYPDGQQFHDFWPSVQHVIGKDILRTHTLFWLAMCHALGIPAYRRLFVSGHLLGHDGRKMSKSLGNGVDPLVAAHTYGVDVLRYTLIREISFGVDGIISDAVIEKRLNRDLADDLGNLVSRTLAMIVKYRDGRVPAPKTYENIEKQIIGRASALPGEILGFVEEIKLAQAMERIFEFVRHLNGYIAAASPWSLAKDARQSDRLDTVLYTLVEAIHAAANLLAPAMPAKMDELRRSLGCPDAQAGAIPWGRAVKPGGKIHEGTLFPKQLPGSVRGR